MRFLEAIEDAPGGGTSPRLALVSAATKKWAGTLAAERMRNRDEKGAAASTASPGSLDGSLHLVAARMAR